MDNSVKELEKFSTTALLLNDLNLNQNDLVYKPVHLKQTIDTILLQQSANINAKNFKIDCPDCNDSIQIYGDKKLLELALAKTLEGIFMCYKDNTSLSFQFNAEQEQIQLIIEIDGQYEDVSVKHLDFERNLPLMLAKLIYKLHAFEIDAFKSKKEYLKISFIKPNNR
jgi:hypothetical protein